MQSGLSIKDANYQISASVDSCFSEKSANSHESNSGTCLTPRPLHGKPIRNRGSEGMTYSYFRFVFPVPR